MIKHEWKLAGATTGSDAYQCIRCGARAEVHTDCHPPDLICRRRVRDTLVWSAYVISLIIVLMIVIL